MPVHWALWANALSRTSYQPKDAQHTHIYIYRHVSAHIHTYDAWPTAHAQYTQHTYTHACIHALLHRCTHIKAIVVCICTCIYIHTQRAHNTDMTCIRIYITYIAWIHIIHTYMHNIHTCMPCIHALHTYITHIHAYLHRQTYIHLHAYTHRIDWLFSRCPILEELLKKHSAVVRALQHQLGYQAWLELR